MPYVVLIENEKTAQKIVQHHFGKGVDFAAKIDEKQREKIVSEAEPIS